jgi:hypothetical protein
MQQTVQQTVSIRKPILVTLAMAWGFEDGAQGRSEYEGYQYFAGELLGEYRTGHQAGKAAMARKQMREAVEMPSEFVAALDDIVNGVTYCKPGIDWAAVQREAIGD